MAPADTVIAASSTMSIRLKAYFYRSLVFLSPERLTTRFPATFDHFTHKFARSCSYSRSQLQGGRGATMN